MSTRVTEITLRTGGLLYTTDAADAALGYEVDDHRKNKQYRPSHLLDTLTNIVNVVHDSPCAVVASSPDISNEVSEA